MQEKLMTFKEWQDLGTQLFGDNPLDWEYICPTCGNIQSARDFIEHKAIQAELLNIEGRAINIAYQECIGRYVDKLGCNWHAGGLFASPFVVISSEGKEVHVFEFATEEAIQRFREKRAARDKARKI